MKRLYIISIFIHFLFVYGFSQQSTATDYFISTSQTRTFLNPAFRPEHGYIGIPLLSNIYADIKTNNLNLDRLTYKKSGYDQRLTFMHPEIQPADFLKSISENNYLAVNMSYKIINIGFYTGKQFWTIDMGIRVHADINLKKGLFRMMKEGFSSDMDEKSPPIKYDLKNTGGSASAFGEIGLGYSISTLGNNLQIGARAKVLLGIGNFESNVDRLDVEYGYDIWRLASEASLGGSFRGITPAYDENGIFQRFTFSNDFGLSGGGLGLDIGAVYDLYDIADMFRTDFIYHILSRTKISLAFTDIGFISWSGKNSVKLTSTETDVIVDFNDMDYNEGNQVDEQFQSLLTDLERALDFKASRSNTNRTTSLSTTMNIGIEYEVWDNNMTVGLLSSTQFVKQNAVTELTISANLRPERAKWVAGSFSYSFIHGGFRTFGLAIHLAPSRGVNFFLASDYVIPYVNSLFLPTLSKAYNIQFGLSVPLGSNHSD